MSFLFGSPKVPAPPPPPPPPPERDDPAIAEAKKKERASTLRRKGRRSLVLTGGQGVQVAAPLSQPQAGGANILG